MKSLYLAALGLAGCVATSVKVTSLRPSPRPLTARAVDSVVIYKHDAPANAIDVYTLDAQDGSADERLGELRARAAQLGCDGLVVHLDTATERREVTSASTTGSLIDRHEVAPSHTSATCIVLPQTDPGSIAR